MENNNIKDLLINNNISRSFINMASKMNIDLPALINDKLILNFSKENIEVIVSTMLGVYGNFISRYYFESLGYNVKSEVDIEEDNKITTSCDLVISKNDEKYYGEVKMAPYLIYNDNKKMSDDNFVYEMMADKLLTQIKKLKTVSDNVFVVLFDGCEINDELNKKLNELDVKKVQISVNVIELKNQIMTNLNNIVREYAGVKIKRMI